MIVLFQALNSFYRRDFLTEGKNTRKKKGNKTKKKQKLVSLFNGISTFVGYLMPKLS